MKHEVSAGFEYWCFGCTPSAVGISWGTEQMQKEKESAAFSGIFFDEFANAMTGSTADETPVYTRYPSL